MQFHKEAAHKRENKHETMNYARKDNRKNNQKVLFGLKNYSYIGLKKHTAIKDLHLTSNSSNSSIIVSSIETKSIITNIRCCSSKDTAIKELYLVLKQCQIPLRLRSI